MNKDFPYVRWNIDTCRHNTRPIRHAFPKASHALVALVLNFCLHPELAISTGAARFTGRSVSRKAARSALDALLEGGYAELLYDYGTGMKRPRVYRRTARFEHAFRMRVTELWAPEKALDAAYAFGPDDGTPLDAIPEMERYAALARGARLSVSDGSQVTRRVWLAETGGMLYARGDAPYQTLSHGPEGKRRLLMIDGLPTSEIDYPAMHFNLLLNRCGLPSDESFYEHAMKAAGLEPTKEGRAAFKLLAISSLNCRSIHKFRAGCLGSAEKPTRLRVTDRKSPRFGQRLIDVLGVRPRDIRDALIGFRPELAPYVCAHEELWLWLQAEEGAIMACVLNNLASRGILGLPEFDSVIVQSGHADEARRAMAECYERRTGFPIDVR